MDELFGILCVNLLLQQVGSEQLVNIALGKTPTQNGTLNFPQQGTHPWIVSNSVDGRTDCEYVDEHHYSATAVTDNPWWQLDLGYLYKIYAVHVLGRRETSLDQLAGFKLSAGIAEKNLKFVYRNNDTVYNAGDIWINTTMTARIIRIDLPNDEVTHRKHGGTLTLCEVEVYVPTDDIIKNSSIAAQSSEYINYGGHFAIDGIYPTSNNPTPESCQCCSVTYRPERPWWTLNFGKPRMIGWVSITGRMDSPNAYQSKDFSIFISNTTPAYASGMFGELVWNLTNSTQGHVFRYTFEPPRIFQYMSIARTDHGSPYMTICEVDFITVACTLGRFGDRCSRQCHCSDSRSCAEDTGRCQSPGCMTGWKGDNCECQSNHYGSNCSQTCGRCATATTCNVTDGTCPNGCAPNYDTTDKMCKNCISGYYGPNCLQTCGHCIGGSTNCSVINGTCSAGCAPGYNSSDRRCQTACSKGHYGVNCSGDCGHCINGTSCLKNDGTCLGGCALGYDFTDMTCKKECQPGHYGLNCLQRCGHCFEDTNTCNNTDGSCPTGCAAGYNHTADNKCNKEPSSFESSGDHVS